MYVLLLTLGCAQGEKTLSAPYKSPQKTTTGAEDYQKWFNSQKKQIRSSIDRELLSQYIQYLKTQKKSDAEKITNKLIQLARSKHQQHSSEWFGLFKNNPRLIYKNHSVATLGAKNFLPLVEAGDETAMTLFLIYSATMTIDRSEMTFFSQTAEHLSKNQSAQLARITEKYQSFFQQHPPIVTQ